VTEPPRIGWKWITWGDAPKRMCAKCMLSVRHGIVSISCTDPTTPAFNILCARCHAEIMQAVRPEEWGNPDTDAQVDLITPTEIREGQS